MMIGINFTNHSFCQSSLGAFSHQGVSKDNVYSLSGMHANQLQCQLCERLERKIDHRALARGDRLMSLIGSLRESVSQSTA